MDLFGKKAAIQNEQLKQQLYQYYSTIQQLQQRLNDLGYTEYTQALSVINAKNAEIGEYNQTILNLRSRINELRTEEDRLTSQVRTARNKLLKLRELYKSIEYAIASFFDRNVDFNHCKITAAESDELEELSPSVILKLHAMDMKDLRKAFRENDKQIDSLLTQYASRYTTKSNKSIYQLMVIALRAELQNILYNLKYQKLDEAVNNVQCMTAKYLTIAADGNQSIAGTMTKFIGELEYLFINAVKIEYNYYVKKEQARQEQLAIREQIKQETAERKALETERKKIEAEEEKYKNEINNIEAKLASASGEELLQYKKRIEELQGLLSDVIIKKEDIINLQNGKAGNIYIISNLGSFGENVFKIGMTRRLDPQDRVNELGDASVPFKFDVHSFIFSEDAVSLEAKLHKELENRRVNKVNPRKEFFNISIVELEALVTKIEPTAEFNRVMTAEDYRQSQSTDEVYTSSYQLDDLDDNE